MLQVIDYARSSEGVQSTGGIEKDNFPRDNLAFPHNLLFYMSHLEQLGLAKLAIHEQDPLYSGESGNQRQTGIRTVYQYLLTVMGTRFLEACHSPAEGAKE